MKRKLLVTLTLALSLGLVLTLAIAYAQEPTREPSEEETGNNIDGMGLADPPLSGFSVLYMFTGVANDTDGEDQVATVVHCTNFGSTATTIGIQFFLSNGNVTGSTFTENLDPNRTNTYATRPTFFGAEQPLNTALIDHGSGRVMVQGHSQVICTAQLLQPGTITPTFMSELDMYKP
jgi:hypothetical protein